MARDTPAVSACIDQEQLLQALERRRAQLARAERLTGTGSLEWDVRADVVHCSVGLCSMIGMEPREFSGSLAAFLERMPEAHRTPTAEWLQEAVARGGQFDAEHRLIRGDGVERIVQSRCVVAQNDGEVLLTCACIDVTELRAAERASRRAHDEKEPMLAGLEARRGRSGATTPLSKREREVIGFVARGLTSAEIAARLVLSAATVESHVRHAMAKLGARSRAQAVAHAIFAGEI